MLVQGRKLWLKDDVLSRSPSLWAKNWCLGWFCCRRTREGTLRNVEGRSLLSFLLLLHLSSTWVP